MAQATKEEIEGEGPGIGPWVIVACVLLFLEAMQYAIVTRVSLAEVGQYSGEGLGTLARIHLAFALAIMALGAGSLVALLAMRNRFGLLFAVASLVLCNPILPLLRTWLLNYRQLGPGGWGVNYLLDVTAFLSVVLAGYLLVSERVEAVYGVHTREPVQAFWAKLKRMIRNR